MPSLERAPSRSRTPRRSCPAFRTTSRPSSGSPAEPSPTGSRRSCPEDRRRALRASGPCVGIGLELDEAVPSADLLEVGRIVLRLLLVIAPPADRVLALTGRVGELLAPFRREEVGFEAREPRIGPGGPFPRPEETADDRAAQDHHLGA